MIAPPRMRNRRACYFEIYQSASALVRVDGAAVAGVGADGGGVVDVTAVGHVAGAFAEVDTGAVFAAPDVDADPDVDDVFRYHSASADAVRLAGADADAFAAAGFAAGVAIAPERCPPVLAPAPACAVIPAAPRCARASNGPSWKINVCAGRVRTAYGNCSSHDISTRPDDVSVKIAGTCFMSLNCT